MAGWFKKLDVEPEPLDVALRVSVGVRALHRRELPLDGTLRAPGLAQEGTVSGELGSRRLVLRFESDAEETLVLRAVSRAYREAPIFSLSVYDGFIETPLGERRFSVELRFDFRHDFPELLRTLHVR
jgi:hypothetical protein